jgi:hypothetical protein
MKTADCLYQKIRRTFDMMIEDDWYKWTHDDQMKPSEHKITWELISIARDAALEALMKATL